MPETDIFKHSTPSLYHRCMGPLLFEPYARHVAGRVAVFRPGRILETAAGTGILTRAMSEAMPEAQIVATDINPAVVEFAASHLRSERVRFQTADAQALPFEDGVFDLTVCLFGAMFFPDRVRANSEAHRVLRPGGRYVVVTFDSLDLNPIPRTAEEAVSRLFPNHPLRYMERGPFSYADVASVREDLLAASFCEVDLETVRLSTRVNASEAAQGMVLGSPLRAEIARIDPSALERATEAVSAALEPWDGREAPMSAHVAMATR